MDSNQEPKPELAVPPYGRFLQGVIDDIASMDGSLFPPPFPIEQDATVVGVASPLMQKLFSLFRYYMREKERAIVDFRYVTQDDQSYESMRQNIDELSHKCEVIRSVFWSTVMTDMQLWGKAVGIRRDWKIIVRPNDAPGQNPLADFFNQLFGGGPQQ